jgi:hypothetical protein
MKRLPIALTLIALATALPSTAADKFADYKAMAKQQASNYAAEKLNLPTPAPAGARAYFPTLKDGDTVSSPVTVVFGVSNIGVAPAGTQVDGTGHHHLLIDDPTIDYTVPMPATDNVKHFGKGQTETVLALKPGKHTLQLVFGDWKHQAFNPSIQSDKITITVK